MAKGKRKVWIFWGIVGVVVFFYFTGRRTSEPMSPYVVYTKHVKTLKDIIYNIYGLPVGTEGDICILDLRSSKLQRLTFSGDNKRPTASPYGKIFYASGEEGRESIWMIDLVKKNNQPLFKVDYYCTNPVCSHDGLYLLFEGNPNGARDILRCKYDGSEIKILTRGVVLCGSPDWSANNKQIVYDCRADGAFFSLWLMDSSGASQRPIVGEERVNFQRPVWQPNGRWIAFQSDKASNRYNDCGIFALKLGYDGKVEKMVNVAVDGHDNRNPRWSPNGEYIIYQSYRSGTTFGGRVAVDFDLYSVKFDENMAHEPECLTTSTTNETDPCWLPLPRENYMKDDLLQYLSDGLKDIDSLSLRPAGTGI